jgi:hypothetical protein
MKRLLAFLCLMACGFSSCERRTQVKIEGGNPPTFALSGSGRLDELLVFAPEQEQKSKVNPFDDENAIWIVKAEGEAATSKNLVEHIGKITYGVVPKGYSQTKPIGGPLPPLISGKRYKYWFVTVNAPWAAGYFEVRDGKAVPVNGP